MSELEISEFIKSLPKDTDPNFSRCITQFVNEEVINEKNCYKNKKIEELLEILENQNNSNDEDKLFAVFYTIVVYYRKMYKITELGEIIKKYKEKFSSRPLYIFSKSYFALSINTRDSYDESLFLAEECIEKINNKDNDYNPDYIGFYNHYSTVVASFLEKGFEIDEVKVKKAKDYITKCISIEKKYSTYYFTRAKLQIYTQSFADATKNIQKAIDLESDRSKILEYQDAFVKLRLEEQKNVIDKIILESNQLKNIIEDYKISIENSKKDILGYLGFFTGIIAFIITSIDIATNSTGEAISLIILTLGALLTGFGLFFSMIVNHNKTIYLVVIGIILIIYASIIPNWL